MCQLPPAGVLGSHGLKTLLTLFSVTPFSAYRLFAESSLLFHEIRSILIDAVGVPALFVVGVLALCPASSQKSFVGMTDRIQALMQVPFHRGF